MAKRSKTLAFAFFACAFIAHLPTGAYAQGQAEQPAPATTEPTAPGQPKTDAEAAPTKQGELLIPAETKPATAATQAPATDTSGTYTIKQGDTLWDISNTFLKDPFLWPLIWKVNPSITNPDLIYPGNALIIPSIAPVERAMQAPAKAAPEEEQLAEEQPAPQAPLTTQEPRPRRRPLQPETPAAQEEAPSSLSKLYLPEETAVPIIDKYSMLSAGFVNEVENDDRITGSVEPKTVFSYDDLVFIQTPSLPSTSIGDKFIIYAPLKNVKHPITGQNYGRLIKVLGLLQVVAKDTPETLTARITLSFDASNKGSLITPYVEPTLIYNPERNKAKNISGYILEVVDNRSINAQTDIVYLDKGTLDGVEAGDRFLVYADNIDKDHPRKMIGELQVFLVKEVSATAVVRKSIDTLAKGDVVEFKK